MARLATRRGNLRRGRAYSAIATVAFFLWSAPVLAADIKLAALDKTVTAVAVIGEIKSGDAARVRAIAPLDKRVVVMLESPGGNLREALQIGEYIRSKGFSTLVINGSDCNSACALIWLAGSPRSISRSVQLGFHAAYTEEKGGDARESGQANALVGRYLTLLNLPESAVLFATTAPPDKLNFLTAFNYQAIGIGTKVIDDVNDGPETKAASNEKPSKPDIDVWKDVGIWSIGVDHTVHDNCFLHAKYEDHTSFRIGVDDIEKSQFYIILLNPKWQSLKEGENYKIDVEFDNFGAWGFPAIASTLDNQPALYGIFSDLKFWTEFIKGKVLQISTKGKLITKLNISGSPAAFEELGRCQRHQNAQKKSSDPFAS